MCRPAGVCRSAPAAMESVAYAATDAPAVAIAATSSSTCEVSNRSVPRRQVGERRRVEKPACRNVSRPGQRPHKLRAVLGSAVDMSEYQWYEFVALDKPLS